MLEGVFEIGYIVIIVVGVGEKRVAGGKHVCRAQVGRGQLCLFGVFDFGYLFGVVAEGLAQFVAQVGVGVAVADNLDGIVGADAAMVCGDDYLVVAACQVFEELSHHGMAKPAEGDAAVSRFVVGKFKIGRASCRERV